jgi:membrane peptidoglycan carboxypeptidase
MRLISIAGGLVTIEISQLEYDAIASALGETLEALEDWEFATRTGVDPLVMRALLAQFREHDPEPGAEGPV